MNPNLIETKKQLLDYLDSVDYYQRESTGKLLRKLVAGTDEDDLDFKKALEDGVTVQIIDLLMDCYSAEDLIDWLADHDMDIFDNYRYADVEYLEDYDDLEDMKENSEAFYNGEPDCLFINEDKGVYVISW